MVNWTKTGKKRRHLCPAKVSLVSPAFNLYRTELLQYCIHKSEAITKFFTWLSYLYRLIVPAVLVVCKHFYPRFVIHNS